MSYILDALKKAQHDRVRENAIDVEDLTSFVWDSMELKKDRKKGRKGFTGVLVILVTALALIVSVVYFFYEKKSIEHGLMSEADNIELHKSELSNSQGREENGISVTGLDGIDENFGRVPEITVTGSIYMGNGASGNKIFIRDREYREGDVISGQWMLFHIGPQAIELRSGDRVVLVDY